MRTLATCLLLGLLGLLSQGAWAALDAPDQQRLNDIQQR